MALPSDDGPGRPDSDLEPRRRSPDGEGEDSFSDEEHEAASPPAFFPPSNNFPTALESTSRLLLLPSRPPSRAKVRSLIVLCACVVGVVALMRSPDVSSGMEAEMSDAEVLAVVPQSAPDAARPEAETRALIDPARDAVEAAMVGHQRVSKQDVVGMETRALIEPAVAVEMAPVIEQQQQPEAAQMPAVDEPQAYAPQAQESTVAMPRQQGAVAGFQGQGSAMMPRNGPSAGRVPSQGNGVPSGPRPAFSGQGPQQVRPVPNQEPWGDVPRDEPYLARLRNHPADGLRHQADPQSQQPRTDDLTPEEREQRREKFRKQQEKLVEQTKRIEDLRVVQERAREEKILEKLNRAEGKNKKMVEDEVSAEQVQEVPMEQVQVQGREEVWASEQVKGQVEERQAPQVQPQLRTIAIESDEEIPSPDDPFRQESDGAMPSLEGPVATQARGFQVNYDEVMMNGAGILDSLGAFAIVSCLFLAAYLA